MAGGLLEQKIQAGHSFLDSSWISDGCFLNISLRPEGKLSGNFLFRYLELSALHRRRCASFLCIMDIIDLSSSPAPTHRRKGKRKQTHEEVIEIMSDDEGVPPLLYRQNQIITARRTEAIQGHSAMKESEEAHQLGDAVVHPQNPPPPLFYPSNDKDPTPPPLHSRPATPQPALSVLPVDPTDAHLARIIEVVPDVQPVHALGLVERFIQSNPEHVVELVLHAIFEDPSYPKIDRKGKRKRDADEATQEPPRASLKPKIDYLSAERVFDGSPYYFDLSMEQLMLDFPRIPKPHIRKRLLDLRFYARTFLKLRDDLAQQTPPFKLKTTNSVVSGKGKARQDDIFTNELAWLQCYLTELDAAAAQVQAGEADKEQDEDGIECGCCFSSYAFDKMIQCPEAHLFCTSCMVSYASTLLGEHNPNIVCMDQSGCKLLFPESELRRFLSPKLLELYERVKQRKDIEAAGLENLEECPFCEYKCVIDNEMEKLFRCENAECGAVTCRTCKKPDHLPKACKEVEDDRHLDAQHVVEEAMTRALMRNCPKCQKAFIKEHGCNKMTCPNCHTVSCYVCRKIIHGYGHFDESPHARGRSDKGKCALWDQSVEKRHADEVSAAAKRALEELKSKQPGVDASAIKVDIPVAPASPAKQVVLAPPAALGADPWQRPARERAPRRRNGNGRFVHWAPPPPLPPPAHHDRQPPQQHAQPPVMPGVPFVHAPLLPPPPPVYPFGLNGMGEFPGPALHPGGIPGVPGMQGMQQPPMFMQWAGGGIAAGPGHGGGGGHGGGHAEEPMRGVHMRLPNYQGYGV